MRTKAVRVKELLSRKDGASNFELSKISLRYGAIIHNLRKEGYVIIDKRINNQGLWRYKLQPTVCKHAYTINNGEVCANCGAELVDKVEKSEEEARLNQQSFDLFNSG